jgi:hypothetical protein
VLATQVVLQALPVHLKAPQGTIDPPALQTPEPLQVCAVVT